MLRVVEDDPDNQRLVLRADPWNTGDLLRRLLITAVMLLLAAGVVGLFMIAPVLPAIIATAIFLVIAFVVSLVLPNTEQVDAIVVDGRSRSLQVYRRGRRLWFTTKAGGPVNGDALLRLRAGLVARHGFHRPEFGLDLHASPHPGGPQQCLAPTFAVEGVDRRDEARALAAAIARRLGLGLVVEQDDALLYQVRITAAAPDPPPGPEQTAGYRRLPRAARLAHDALPSFEPPQNPPALDLATAGTVLQRSLTRAETGELVAAPLPIDWKESGLTPILILLALVPVAFAVLYWIDSSPPLLGAALGLFIITFLALGALACVLVLFPIVWGLEFLLRMLHCERDPKPHFFNTLPLWHWRLGEDTLSGRWRPLVWRRGDVQAVVVVGYTGAVGKPPQHVHHTAICLRTRRGWVRLARTRWRSYNPRNEDLPPPPPPILALAIEVARTLDAPLRAWPAE